MTFPDWADFSNLSLAIFILVVVLLVAIIWSIRRHRSPDLEIECDFPIDDLVHSLAGLSLGTAVRGNSVELLENGAFFDAVIEAIGKAEHSVHFETFLWKEGELGKRMAAALAERARAGKQVRVLLDEAAVRAARTIRSLPASAPREAVLPVRFRLR